MGALHSASAQAIQDLYKARFGDFLRVATAITGSAESGREAVQDAFARLLRDQESFRGEGSMDGWAWRAVVHAARNVRRRQGVEERHQHVGASDQRNGSAPDPQVRALVASLPERQKLAVFLRYYADLDYEQIAEALNVRPGTVAATLHKAHARLRQSLEGVKP